MHVEIWSDIMCPFCYIGKRRFEKALKDFPGKENVTVEWKSFQLNPDMKTAPEKNINQYLAEVKGWSVKQAGEANARVTAMASSEGLHYDLGKAVVANSFDAHRLIQLAKANKKGDEAEERLFKAYFSEGKNIADHETLIQLGREIGLDPQTVKTMLESTEYSDAVASDIGEASRIGVRGVPFFVFDRKYAVSGAQETEVFENTLKRAAEA
jgi:predicted DsbA family dithiol-disulfide isomerase